MPSSLPRRQPESSAGVSAPTDPWYCYILRGRGDYLYTGVARDPDRRLAEHCAQGARCARSLRGRLPLQRVWLLELPSHSAALRLERRIKALSKLAKEQLIAGHCAPPTIDD